MFRRFGDVFGPVRTFSDAFGHVRMHSDTFRCNADAFGHVRKNPKVLIFFWKKIYLFWTFGDVFQSWEITFRCFLRLGGAYFYWGLLLGGRINVNLINRSTSYKCVNLNPTSCLGT